MDLIFRQCTQEDLYALQQISRSTFQETFSDQNAPAELQAYLDKAYHEEKLQKELLNENSWFYFLYPDGSLSGYMKLNEGSAQTEFRDQASLEIERIYILQKFQGFGLGGYLINKAAEMANARGKRYVWLGVWEKNEKALAFYKKHGFYRIGAHPFFVGNDEQTDYIMRKDL